MIKYFFQFLFLICFSQIFGQQTAIYSDPLRAYNQGVELFENNNFLSARQKFEEIYRNAHSAPDNKPAVALQNIEFYIAACAAEKNEPDAEKLLLDFYKKYHETDYRKLVYWYLGKMYYQNGKYTEAIDWLSKVKSYDLSSKNSVENKFYLGYSYFVKKKMDEAKPLFKDIKEIKEKFYYPSNYYYAFICFYKKEFNEALKSFLSIEDSKMYSSVIPYYVSQIYYLKKDNDKTISYIKSNIDKTEILYKEDMNHLLGEAYFQKSEYALALPLIEKYVKGNDKVRKEDLYELAYCYYQNKDYKSAIEYFTQLNLLSEKMGQNATYSLADCYLKTNQKGLAKTAFQSAASMDFDPQIKSNSLFHYGKLSFEEGNSNEAIPALESYLKTNPTGVFEDEANDLLAAALVQTKDYERAYKIIESIKSTSPLLKETYQKVTYFRAIEKFNDKNYEEAISLGEKSLKNDLNLELAVLANYLLGESYFLLQKNDKAKESYQKFTQNCSPAIASKNKFSMERGEYGIGYCLFKTKNYTAALPHFKKAVAGWSQNQTDEVAKLNLQADAYMRLGDCAFVTKEYNQALAAYQNNFLNKRTGADYAGYQSGIMLGLLHKNEEKITTLRNVIQEYPSSEFVPLAYYEIGETYMENEQYSPAIQEYKKLISDFPKHAYVPKSYLKIALASYNSGKKEEALNSFKAVVQDFSNTKEAKEALVGIKDLSVELGKPEEYLNYAHVSASEKDSLTFEAAQSALSNNDCAKAIDLLANYLKKFPKGYFVVEAHHQRVECLLAAKKYDLAIVDLDALTQNKSNSYYEKSLLDAAGISYYELKNNESANAYYHQLYEASSSTSNTYTALKGLLNTAVALQKSAEIIEFVDKICKLSTAKETDINEALYQKGKAYLTIGNPALAYDPLNTLSLKTSSEKAAEAKYLIAHILNERKEYKASNDTCIRLKNKFGSYEFWVVKTYILMADNYQNLGNDFQAKATLESIVDNYEGDKVLLEEAKQKLELLKNASLKKSLIDTSLPSDTLILEKPKQ